MKRTTLLLLALLPVVAMAQNTAEAILGLCPPLPDRSRIVGYKIGYESDFAAISQYLSVLSDAIEQAESAVDKRYKTSIDDKNLAMADAHIRRETGKSLGEFQTMGEAEIERFGRTKVDERLKSLGINKSVEELENRELSEAEKKQIANSMVRKASGMSLSELQAMAAEMENMSDEEQVAYMQSSGMADRIRSNATKNGQTSSPEIPSELHGQISQSGYDELTKWGKEWDEWYDGLSKLEDELNEKWITLGYDARSEVWEKKIGSLPPGFVGPKDPIALEHETMKAIDLYHEQVIAPQIKAVKSEYLHNVSAKEWCAYIMKGLNLIKQRIQLNLYDYETLSDYMKELHGYTMAYFAIMYLDYAKKFVDVPMGREPQNDPID